MELVTRVHGAAGKVGRAPALSVQMIGQKWTMLTSVFCFTRFRSFEGFGTCLRIFAKFFGDFQQKKFLTVFGLLMAHFDQDRQTFRLCMAFLGSRRE